MVKLHLGDLAIASPFVRGRRPRSPPTTRAMALMSPPRSPGAPIPSGTRQLALVCHDPDGAPLPTASPIGVVYGIPPDVRRKSAKVEEAAFTEGQNDFGKSGLLGARPRHPDTATHYYYFPPLRP